MRVFGSFFFFFIFGFSGPVLSKSGLVSSVVVQKFQSGTVMMNTGYSDMPYMVNLPNGDILSTLTVSDGKEGNDDQHVVIIKSRDGGRSWSKPIPLEPADGPEASWAMPYLDGNRLYVFYNYNVRNVRSWPMSNGKNRKRVDLLGELAVRYSDDYGVSWSDRVIVPIPRTSIDKENGFNSKEVIMWICGAPIKIGEYHYIGLSKGGISHPKQILPHTEGFLFRTTDLLNPKAWELIPGGDHGFKNPDKKDTVSEETSFTEIGKEGIYVVYRTTTGKLAQAISTDAGQNWKVDWARHIDGRPVNNPRAKPKVYRLQNQKYILWFHNNDARSWFNRNPVWLSCGVQSKKGLLWGEPFKII